MISKERLEELIKEEKIVYIPDDLWGTIGTLNLKKDFLIKEGRIHGELGDLGLEGASCSCSIPFEDLYETKDDAEFALEFGNITRTETLKLPTWEEFKKLIDKDNFHFIDKNHSMYTLAGWKGDINIFSPDDDTISITMKLTQENYITACRICKKIFLGENVS